MRSETKKADDLTRSGPRPGDFSATLFSFPVPAPSSVPEKKEEEQVSEGAPPEEDPLFGELGGGAL